MVRASPILVMNVRSLCPFTIMDLCLFNLSLVCTGHTVTYVWACLCDEGNRLASMIQIKRDGPLHCIRIMRVGRDEKLPQR